MRIVHAAVLLSTLAFFGPPHITVHTLTAKTGGDPVFELEVEHHTTPEDMHLTGRAESVQNGHRISNTLTIVHTQTGRYTVSKQWEGTTPWLLVFSAAQGAVNASHGVAEAIVSIDALGAVKNIEYLKPGFLDAGKTRDRESQEKLDAALRALGLRETGAK